MTKDSVTRPAVLGVIDTESVCTDLNYTEAGTMRVDGPAPTGVIRQGALQEFEGWIWTDKESKCIRYIYYFTHKC